MANPRREAIPDELHQLIEALTTAVDARDHYTAQHSWRIGCTQRQRPAPCRRWCP